MGLQTVGEWGKPSWEEEFGVVLPFSPGSRLELRRSQIIDDDDSPFIVLTETKLSKRHIPVDSQPVIVV